MKIYRLGIDPVVVRSPCYDVPGGMAFRVLAGAHYRTRMHGGVIISHWLAAQTARAGDTRVDAARREAEKMAPHILRSAKYRAPFEVVGYP